MQITTTPVTDEGITLGELHEVEEMKLGVYRDVTGYLALDVPGKLTPEKAVALHTLLGKVLQGDQSGAVAATGRP